MWLRMRPLATFRCQIAYRRVEHPRASGPLLVENMKAISRVLIAMVARRRGVVREHWHLSRRSGQRAESG